MKLGFIGLGRMGQAMAQRLLTAGHALTVYNRTPGKTQALIAAGAHGVSDIAGACAGQDAVVTMLADDAALREVVYGDGRLLAALPAGSIHIAMGTHSVAMIEELAQAHARVRQTLIAAPMLGRPEVVAAGQAGIVPAGPADALERCRPVFDAIGRQSFVAGSDPTAAIAVKLANNFVLGCAVEAMGEGFAMTRKFGVDPKVFLDVLTQGLFAAPAYKVYGDIIAREAYDEVGFTATLGLKDINLALAAAQSVGVPLPSGNVYRDRLIGALAHGEAERDWAVMARDQARASGLVD
jgi:3-hydroxyisobutyrate dehydrogenase-like beta-hydroxyacid dehydrogenase